MLSLLNFVEVFNESSWFLPKFTPSFSVSGTKWILESKDIAFEYELVLIAKLEFHVINDVIEKLIN